jgi:serine/threonine-protein kinase
VIGTVIDKYEVLQKIGEGGMATVYRGRHLTLGRDVAIKVLHPHLSSSPRNRRRFAREARAIEHLNHPHILQIFDYSGVDTDDCYIVTEFVEGATLKQLLEERGRLPSETVILLGIRLTEALAYAHREGIVHRDLKLENVMLRRDGALKLMDFGIARFMEDAQVTIAGALVGSPAYMSPEQAQEGDLDHRSDLFSLGTLLYHLTTGTLPFQGRNPSVILRNLIENNRANMLELCPSAAPALSDLTDRLLQPAPEDRYADAGEVNTALREALQSVHIDPEEAKWALQRFLVQPEAFDSDLDSHLREILLAEGKTKLENGESLDALRLLNRLLSIEPQNTEVLTLVRGLHETTNRQKPSPNRRFVFGAVALAALSTAAVFLLQPKEPPAPQHVEPAPVVQVEQEPESRVEPLTPPEETRATTDPVVPPTPTVVAAATPVRPRSKQRPTPDKAERENPNLAADLGDASVRIVLEGRTWARIEIDGAARGLTGREPILVSPGQHELVLRNDYAEPYTRTFTVAPGESVVLENIQLRPLPVTIRIDDSVDASCMVSLDGTTLGRVGALGRTFQIPDPKHPHEVVFQCAAEPAIVSPLEPLTAGAIVRLPGPP